MPRYLEPKPKTPKVDLVFTSDLTKATVIPPKKYRELDKRYKWAPPGHLERFVDAMKRLGAPEKAVRIEDLRNSIELSDSDFEWVCATLEEIGTITHKNLFELYLHQPMEERK